MDGKWKVQVGKGKSAYSDRYVLDTESEARFYYRCLNTFNGYKKRLVSPDGKIIARMIT